MRKDNSSPKDAFYPADTLWQWAIALGMGATALLANASDDILLSYFPTMVLNLRHFFGAHLIQIIWRTALGLHAAEGTLALLICLRRKWYSPTNTFKWTVSTLLFGIASLVKLLQHDGTFRNH